jgi:TetR/AcrR family transcriptional regulator of autoinduction and epiphytic fitness
MMAYGKDDDLREWRAPTGVEEPTPRDGRAARALRTRNAVADGLLELIEEGELRPTSKAIAERAGIAERTLFQHFEDLETLFSVAASRVGEGVVRNLGHIPDDGPFEDRLSAYLDELIFFHEAMSPLQRASRVHEPYSPVVRRAASWWHDLLRRGIERVFGQELTHWPEDERRNVVEALTLTVAWTSWDSMRVRSELTKEQARAVMELSVRTLLGQLGDSTAGVAPARTP